MLLLIALGPRNRGRRIWNLGAGGWGLPGGGRVREKKKKKKTGENGERTSGVCPSPCPSYLLFIFYAGFYERNLPREIYTTRGQMCNNTQISFYLRSLSVQQQAQQQTMKVSFYFVHDSSTHRDVRMYLYMQRTEPILSSI